MAESRDPGVAPPGEKEPPPTSTEEEEWITISDPMKEEPPEDLWVNARDLWRILRRRHDPIHLRTRTIGGPLSDITVYSLAPDPWGMYQPNLLCLRAILRGNPSGCEYGRVRVVRMHKIRGVYYFPDEEDHDHDEEGGP